MNERKKRLDIAFNYIQQHYGVHTKRQLAQQLEVGESGLYSAFNGNELYLTDNLLVKIVACFPDISLDWLKNGTGEMVKENHTSSEDEQVDKIILLYSHLIKEIEDLRKELTIEIEQTRQVRTQLMAACTEIQGISTSFQQVFSSSVNAPLLAADKPNVYPNPQKDET